MFSVSFECENITPIFMYGTDQRIPELRAPSIKGLMRYWWRAIKSESKEILKEEEANIFGSTDEKIGRSKFNIRLDYELKQSDIKMEKLLPHHSKDRTNQCPICRLTTCNKGFQLPAISPGKKFITIIDSNDKNILHKAESILEILLMVGSIGRRGRRGFGSIFKIDWNFKNINDFGEYLLNKLNAIKNDFSIENLQIKRKSSFKNSMPYAFVSEIIFGKADNNIGDLLKKIGMASHNNRDPSLGNAQPRMSSPVYVSIKRLNKNYFPVITKFHPSYPPSYPMINLKKIEQFIKDLT